MRQRRMIRVTEIYICQYKNVGTAGQRGNMPAFHGRDSGNLIKTSMPRTHEIREYPKGEKS